MSASAVSSPIGSRPNAIKLEFVAQAMVLRALLLCGCLATVAIAAWIGRPEAYLAADADLARLLRGMALIKGFLALAAVGVLLWRFGHPLSQRMAGAYLVGAWLAAGASMLVWQLTLIPLAALVFHLGEITMLLTAWRDRTGRRGDILS
jgi:hypothetical protein